jgi:hypothetical protein
MIDCAKCHEKQTVRDYCDKEGIVVKFVPKRLTNLLQPADVMLAKRTSMIVP